MIRAFAFGLASWLCIGHEHEHTNGVPSGSRNNFEKLSSRFAADDLKDKITFATFLLSLSPQLTRNKYGTMHRQHSPIKKSHVSRSRSTNLMEQNDEQEASARVDKPYTLISTALLAQLLEVDKSPSMTMLLPPSLSNRYFALRHGQSESNVEGIISSDPSVGTVKHGLTAEGRLQARRAATRLVDVVGRDDIESLVFVSSDFTRARQTAEEAQVAVESIMNFEMQACLEDSSRPDAECAIWGSLMIENIVQTPLLRERWFGEFDGTALQNYNQVWPRDLVSALHEHRSVESVDSVVARIRQLILQLESDYSGKSIVLTSHADTLQIAQCFIAGADPRTFSMYRFKNGEFRELLRTPESLPEPVPLTYA